MLVHAAPALLLLTLAAGSTVHQDPEDPLVARFLRTLDRVNGYLSESGRTSVGLPSFGVGSWLGRASLSRGVLGNLSSLVVDGQNILEEEEAAGLNRARTGNKIYSYELWLHMDDLVFRYTYDLSFFGLRFNHGTLRVTPVNNAFTVFGSLNLTAADSCRAGLDDAEVFSFDLLRIEFDQETFFHTVIQYSFDIIVNFVYKSLMSPFQNLLDGYLHLDEFKKQYSEVVCKEFLAQ